MRRLIVCLFLGVLGIAVTASAETTINTSNKWAWSSGTGWINCRTVVTNGSVVSTNGVSVGQYVLWGYMYSPTVGWIDVGRGSPASGTNYSNTNTVDYGVNHDGKGHLTGYAWNGSVGWINFQWTNNPEATRAPKINLQNGYFSGYAWGGSLGWINLSNTSAKLQTVSMATPTNQDSNANDVPDGWEIQTFGTKTNFSRIYDYYVYDHAGMDPATHFALSDFSLSGTGFRLAWDGAQTRIYYIDWKTNLLESGWPNVQGPFSFTTSSAAVVLTNAADEVFYRLRTALPFSPP